MKPYFKLNIVFAISVIIISCSNSNQKINENSKSSFTQIENASWLIGEWQNITEKVYVSEIWIKKNDSTYIGKGYSVAGKDTVSEESILLEQKGTQLFYTSTVKNQNNNQSIKFTLTSSANNQLVFENPEHDFPQKISYTLITNDSLLAEVSGMMNSKQRSEKFPMTRIK